MVRSTAPFFGAIPQALIYFTLACILKYQDRDTDSILSQLDSLRSMIKHAESEKTDQQIS
jgi:hypothetical protein